jgi:hypothetical protein
MIPSLDELAVSRAKRRREPFGISFTQRRNIVRHDAAIVVLVSFDFIERPFKVLDECFKLGNHESVLEHSLDEVAATD